MQPRKQKYPVFEANQVLTSAHLNQVFDYLDEQERLTRANLIGIGVVCGLDIRLDDPDAPTAISLSRGCGITSEGYLIVESDDIELVAYRTYQPPADIIYTPFSDPATKKPYPLWELFPTGEPETTGLTSPVGFLKDKAVILFLELKKSALRSCSPNNCDDKGSDVTVNVRRLLIRRADLDAIIDTANSGSDSNAIELDPSLAAQLNLPDLRLPRFDAPNTSPVSSVDVLRAFLKVFNNNALASTLGGALSAAYYAFRSVLQKLYADDPFSNFSARFGFLDNAPTSSAQVRFLPYYYDLFDDLIRAYDDFREQGLALLCACCPSSDRFPRHLMLGLLFPATELEAPAYRQGFLASPAVSDCEERTRELVLLFQRLVEMTRQFTDAPVLPIPKKGNVDVQVRITPSRLGPDPLADKAIPYYYRQDGTPPLYKIWNPEKSRLFKANQNLSYRADEYAPAAPAFISQPLAFDLEASNFLRIEGHLGKDFRGVLSSLLTLKNQYRLPIDIVALRTGAFDENAPVDLSAIDCRFQDLEVDYEIVRDELLCALVKAATNFYNLPSANTIQSAVASPTLPPAEPVPSRFDVINRYAPDFLVQPNSQGRVFEDYVSRQGSVPDIDAQAMANLINVLPPGDTLVYYSLFYLIPLAQAFSQDLVDADFVDIEIRYQNLLIVIIAIESRRELGIANLEGNVAMLKWEEIDDQLEDLLKNCELDALRAIQRDAIERINAIRKKQFLAGFLAEHPGIQHKAGVPLGGSFILVYHQDPDPPRDLSGTGELSARPIDPFSIGAILAEDLKQVKLPELHFFPPGPSGPFIALSPIKSTVVGGVRARDTATLKPVVADRVLLDLGAVNAATEKASASVNPKLIRSVSMLRKSAAELSKFRIDAETDIASTSPTDPGARANAAVLNNPDLINAIKRLRAQQPAIQDPDLKLLIDNLPQFVGQFPGGGGDGVRLSDQIIANTVESLGDGTVIADFYLPYLCCSSCAPVQFVLPRPRPFFTLEIGCTQAGAEASFAPVRVNAESGQPPYRVKIDQQIYQDLGKPILIAPGEHQLIVQDAVGTDSLTQTVIIPEPIGITEPVFTCSEDGLEYVAGLSITGGTPPYTVNDIPIDGDQFTSKPMASGKEILLRIVDQALCSFEATLIHTCPPPCDLPDDGESRRCAYRLWLQPTDKPFSSYQQISGISFLFNGREITLPNSESLLQISDVDLLNSNFQASIANLIKKLNSTINQALGEKFARLNISYEPAANDPFGILWIEHFVNDKFSISFDFSVSKAAFKGSFSVRYGNDQATDGLFGSAMFKNLSSRSQIRVPAFDCSERNQCKNSPFVSLCSGFNLKPAFTNVRFAKFTIAETMPSEGIAAWVWDFSADTNELFYVGESINVRWDPDDSTVRLTAISDQGCFSSTVETLSV